MGKVLRRSGLGDETYAPPSLTQVPMQLNMTSCRHEFESVAFDVVRSVLNKAGVHPRQVGVVITNSSLFNLTPSLSAAILNHFKMPSTTTNYHLAGMGCSAGVIAVDLARQCLENMPETYVLVVSTENLTFNWYPGCDRSMLVTNTIFRVGGAAILLSNKQSDARRAKYELQHVERTCLAADDAAYRCVHEQEDEKGRRGIRLGKDLMKVAGSALRKNIQALGPRVLPASELLAFAANAVARKILLATGGAGRSKAASASTGGIFSLKPYVPDFSTAFEHVCVHTGGRGVLDTIEAALPGMGPQSLEPSRASLYRYGNVSSSSIWYVLAYIETFRGVARGDRVWQLAFGSGFKCNSAVWVANRGIRGDRHAAWSGFDVEKMREDLAASAAPGAAAVAAGGGSGSGGGGGGGQQRAASGPVLGLSSQPSAAALAAQGGA
jgi:3-ketoacyl-CoA synthase